MSCIHCASSWLSIAFKSGLLRLASIALNGCQVMPTIEHANDSNLLFGGPLEDAGEKMLIISHFNVEPREKYLLGGAEKSKEILVLGFAYELKVVLTPPPPHNILHQTW